VANQTDAFLYDSVLEAEGQSSVCLLFILKAILALTENKESNRRAQSGIRSMHEKIMNQLIQTDETCAKRIAKVWKEMIATTIKDKSVSFNSIEEYLEFRMVDTGAP
jgi:hypothetical protein